MPPDQQQTEPKNPTAETPVTKIPSPLSSEGMPGFAFDYRGRLWVEKKRRGFFRQLRRPNLPPDNPDEK
jgi:hypothetical protein